MTGSARVARRAFLAAMAGAPLALGKERRLPGGRLTIWVPWRLESLDPHDIHDAVAALFGHAIFDTLYGRSTEHPAYPALAADMPRADRPGRLSVRLRPGLRTDDGHALGPRDVAWSLERARGRGALGLLEPYLPVGTDDGAGEVHFRAATEPALLARALSSPVTAIMAPGGSPSRPIGTGAFRATLHGDRLVLHRNQHAARGAAYLDAVVVHAARDLATALRAFEAGDADVGWLGAGLHARRRDARPLDGPLLGWVILRTGPEAGAWGAPGIAQDLLDGVPAARLSPLGLRAPGQSPARHWTGPPTVLWVDRGSPHLVEIARVLAASLSGPGHEIDVRPIAGRELADRRRAKRYGLMVDWVTAMGGEGNESQLSLLTAESPRHARRPPTRASRSLADVARSLPFGVVGALFVSGALAGNVRGLDGWSLSDAWRA